MAVPKKRMSRTRKLLRQSQWKLEIRGQALKALSNASRARKASLSGSNSEGDTLEKNSETYSN